MKCIPPLALGKVKALCLIVRWACKEIDKNCAKIGLLWAKKFLGDQQNFNDFYGGSIFLSPNPRDRGGGGGLLTIFANFRGSHVQFTNSRSG